MDALISIRGGEMAASDDNDEDEDNSPLLSSLRSAIRSLLDFGDSTVPVISSIFRPCVRIMEKLTGVSLLPDIKVKVKKSSKKGKKKSSKKKSSIDDEEDGDADAVEAKKEKKVKSASKALKKPSVTTQKHVSGKLKSTNPNYRIQKELKEFIQSPPPNLSVQVGSNMRAWVVTMVGANNTVYEGEVFKLRINFPKDYPTVPPSVYFLKGYIPTHEHVYTNGDICLSLLGKDWRPTMTAQSIAVSILSILSSAQSKSLPMDNAAHAGAKPGEYQKDWVYHDDVRSQMFLCMFISCVAELCSNIMFALFCFLSCHRIASLKNDTIALLDPIPKKYAIF
ncbi:MAG: hypothetical protein SGILL_004760 [Bacillariaceae sp.]